MGLAPCRRCATLRSCGLGERYDGPGTGRAAGMKPPPFDYARCDSVADVLALLARHGSEAKLLAGGQSLMPMLNFRLLRPAILVDIGRIPDLVGIAETPSGLRIGAMTRHRQVERDALIERHFPVVTEAMGHVAHMAIRNRGTIGGSLCHADPAAEWPMLALLLDATLVVASAAGTRRVAARDFFLASLTTALTPEEMLTEVHLPYLPAGAGSGFAEVAPRLGDFATAAAGAIVTRRGGVIAEARLAVMGVHPTPLRLDGVEDTLRGTTPAAFADAAALAAASVEPNDDLRASADLRRRTLRAQVTRALQAAWDSAEDAA